MNTRGKTFLVLSLGLLVFLAFTAMGCSDLPTPTPSLSPTPTPTPQLIGDEEVVVEAYWRNPEGPKLVVPEDNTLYPETWYCDIGERTYFGLKLTNKSPYNIKIVGVGFGKSQKANPSFFDGFILEVTDPRSTEAVDLEILREGFGFTGRRFGFVQGWEENETILPAGQEKEFGFNLIAKQAGEWEARIRLAVVTNTENRLSDMVIRVVVRPPAPKQ